MRTLFTVIVSLVLCTTLLPQARSMQPDSTAVPHDVQIRYDSSQVVVRSFDSLAMATYRTNPQFQYEDRLIALSSWDRFKLWLHQKWHELLAASNSGRLLDYGLAALGAIALIYLVVKLLGMDNGGVFSRKAKKVALQHTVLDENIHTLDFEGELQQAINEQNYRLAIRLLYLKCLKTLTDHNLIDWQPAKTNADYLRELDNGPLSLGFRTLTSQFEHSWYGDLPVGNRQFEAIRLDFEQFDREVQS